MTASSVAIKIEKTIDSCESLTHTYAAGAFLRQYEAECRRFNHSEGITLARLLKARLIAKQAALLTGFITNKSHEYHF